MEPEELTLWQERLLVARWGERILRECIERGVPATGVFGSPEDRLTLDAAAEAEEGCLRLI